MENNYFKALMLAAKETGMPIIVFGGGGTAAAVAPVAVDDFVVDEPRAPEHEEALAEIAKLRTDLAKTSAERDSLVAQMKAAAGNPGNPPVDVKAFDTKITELTRERDMLSTKINELQGLISQLQSAPKNVGVNGGAPADPGNPEKSIMDYPVDILGVDAKLLKLCATANGAPITTVGQLHAAFMAGKFKAKKRGVEDVTAIFKLEDVLDIAHRLMGRVPTAHKAGENGTAAGNGATAPAASNGASADPTVPAGFVTRPWGDLIVSARKKEKAIIEAAAAIANLTAQVDRLNKDPATPETKAALTKIIGDPLDRKDKDSLGARIKLFEMYQGQFLALLNSAGFDALKLRQKYGEMLTVDQALQEYGLQHLMTGAPVEATA